jgi:hypothetical protein
MVNISKNLTLKEALANDMIIAENMTSNANGDFAEGVRCVLMEKGAIPKWSCDSIMDVSSEAVDSFFVPIKGHVPLNDA